MKHSAHVLLLVLLLSAGAVSAQQHLERWNMDDYFPVGYFYDTTEFSGKMDNARVGEMVYHMRLAGMPVLRDSVPPQGTTLLRLTLRPRHFHPFFVLVTEHDGAATLQWWQGNSVAGHVEYFAAYKWSDTGFYDATESEYHGNDWTPGVRASGSRRLSAAERDTLWAVVRRAELPTCGHTTKCSSFDSKYLLEYRDGERYNACLTECSDRPATRLALLLTAMADSTYLDMDIRSRAGVSFPGGDEACKAFLARELHYPPQGLEKLQECDVKVEFIVERDGSLNDITAPYSHAAPQYFVDSAFAIVSRMPRWLPAEEKGKVVRSSHMLEIVFTLPDSLRPHYGNPILVSRQDSINWRHIERGYFEVLTTHGSAEACYRLGKEYYEDYLVYDSKVVPNIADSALRWFYRACEADSLALMDFFDMYLPIFQLEQLLGLEHNPVCTAPPDSLLGLHIPATYFIEWPKDGRYDPKKNYGRAGWGSFFWSRAFSDYLRAMGEPVLYDSVVTDDVLRCSFYPSFHPTLSFRVEGRTLYWCRLDLTINEKTWEETYYPKHGQVKLSSRQRRHIKKLFSAVDISQPMQQLNVEILDGAQWLIEYRTPTDYKAHMALLPGKNIKALYDYLIELSGVDIR
ncbi:MAG: energy transducer TonB [Bacteroidales bacterium]|nr:energy transducer TonB [Bacteroidales bacterium]